MSDCRCVELGPVIFATDHEDELLVLDTPITLAHRCVLCGRKFLVQHVPGDYAVGDVEFGAEAEPRISQGYRGAPLLPRERAQEAPREPIRFGRWPESNS